MHPVHELLLSHRSIRKFLAEPIEQLQVEQWLKCGQAASTSSFIQACTVVQVPQGEQRDRLAELAANQAFVAEAPVFLVFCADMQRHKQACEQHGSDMLSGYTEQFLTASLDVALFAQNVATAAEAEGMGICYVGALRNNIEQVANELSLPELVYPVFGMCIGKPGQNPEVKPRLPLSLILKQRHYEVDDTEVMAHYDAQIQDYYQQRTGNNKLASWTSQIAAMLKKEARPHMKDFLQRKGFLRK